MRNNIISAVIAVFILSAICYAGSLLPLPSRPVRQRSRWRPHVVRQLNGLAAKIQLSGQVQILSTKRWKRVITVPYIVYMPEKDRLLMLANFDYPHRPFLMTSDDHGDNWTAPRPMTLDKRGKPAGGLGLGLAYLGNGNALLYSGTDRWFTRDYGQTWGETVPTAPPTGKGYWAPWCPPLVDLDKKTGKVSLIAESGCAWFKAPEVKRDYQQAYIRFSRDEGRTWSKDIKVPQWEGVSEVTLFRAGNGDMLAACRTDIPAWMEEEKKVWSPRLNDSYEGLGISVSKDDGQTWSAVNKLYDYGRHHAGLLLMPNGDIVMTYVVRAGYTDSKGGFPQFGLEAVVSRDHGQTWDLDHRYILYSWVGNHKGRNDWWPSPYCATSSLLPDGSIITAVGVALKPEPGRQNRSYFGPRELVLLKWRLNPEPVNDDRTSREARFDSELRNIADP